MANVFYDEVDDYANDVFDYNQFYPEFTLNRIINHVRSHLIINYSFSMKYEKSFKEFKLLEF